jgi:hypothetical protein
VQRSTSITKRLVFQYPFCRKTSCNRILERFFKSNDPRKGPSVGFFRFVSGPRYGMSGFRKAWLRNSRFTICSE